jgi:hypothetical protein
MGYLWRRTTHARKFEHAKDTDKLSLYTFNDLFSVFGYVDKLSEETKLYFLCLSLQDKPANNYISGTCEELQEITRTSNIKRQKHNNLIGAFDLLLRQFQPQRV